MGRGVGCTVGIAVGRGLVGFNDGNELGNLDGLAVGATVGLAEGIAVVGLLVGKYVGALTIGTADGAHELLTKFGSIGVVVV